MSHSLLLSETIVTRQRLSRSESLLYMISTLGLGREGNSADIPPTGGSSAVPRWKRQVGEETIHEAMTEDQSTEGTTFPGGKDLRRRKGPVDSVDCQIHLSRPAYTVSQLRSNLCYASREEHTLLEGAASRLRSWVTCSPGSAWALLLLRVPILAWLPRYKFRNDLVPDIVAGITVAVMHLPQGMAYAMLAEVPPILGLYTAFFPVLAYAFFGTSRHVSMGTFAVACLMTGKVVGDLSTQTSPSMTTTSITLLDSTNATEFVGVAALTNFPGPAHLDQSLKDLGDKFLNSASLAYDVKYASPGDLGQVIAGPSSTTEMPVVPEKVHYTNIQVAVAVSFMVGVWQMIFGLLQLGQISVFLSDMLISGFTTGAACHVLSSQIKHILGIKIARYSGPFRLVYTYMDIFTTLPTANVTAVIMSVVCITVLAINNEVFKPRVKKFTNFPIPIELVVIIVGTVVSHCALFEHTHDLAVVGDIPTGIPDAIVPDHRLFVPVIMDSFVMAIVIYAISFSMAKIFSKKHGYKVDATQELYAGGIGNIFGSLFSSLPSCASLSRSLIQESVGGKTQVTSFVCCAVLVVVMLFVGPVFESLPNCVLASIILVALKGMFLQVYDFLKMWKQSKGDALLWMASFLSTVLVDIDYGLGTGVLLSLLLLLKRNNQPTVTKLGWVNKTDIYVDIDSYQSAVPIPGACLCHVSGALHFANVDHFREQLARATQLDTTQIIAEKAKQERKKVALHNLSADEEITSTPQETTEQGMDSTARGSPMKKDQVIVIENSCHNLTSQVIKEKVASLFKRGSYTSDDGQQACVDEKKEEQGHENKAYIPDDAQYPAHKAQPLGLLKRFTHSSKGPLVPEQDVSFVVLCLSGVGWIDVSAAKQIGALFTEHDNAGISLALAGANDSVMQVMRQCGVLDTIPENRLYHSLHDAVTSLMADVLYSTPQPSSFVGAKFGVKVTPLTTQVTPLTTQVTPLTTQVTPLTTHDARPAVVPAMLYSRPLRPPSEVPVPIQLRASPREKHGTEEAAKDVVANADSNTFVVFGDIHQTQRSLAQSPRQKEGDDAEIAQSKPAKDSENTTHSPTSKRTLQHRDIDVNQDSRV